MLGLACELKLEEERRQAILGDNQLSGFHVSSQHLHAPRSPVLSWRL